MLELDFILWGMLALALIALILIFLYSPPDEAWAEEAYKQIEARLDKEQKEMNRGST